VEKAAIEILPRSCHVAIATADTT